MSVISSRDTMAAASSVVSAATRPGSRVSRMSEMRPVFLLERCLAIRFERIQTVASPTTAPSLATGKNKGSADSRPGSSLSQQISTWLPWQRHQQSKPTNQQQQQQEQPTPPPPLPPPPTAKDSPAGWFYDGGFILYQNFQEANAYCYWNGSLLEAVTSLTFVGHVTPSTILVTGDESCLETVRSAWARKVLRAPSAYTIALVGEVDGCAVQPISQGQFTPLPEALCWVVWELNLAERSTTLDDVTTALGNTFPDLVPPGHKVIYDTLGKLIRDRKIFYNGKGYGVVTPDTYRKTSVVENGEKGLLLSNEEALALAHGTVESYPQGNVIHKAIQTNLVDVICRGNGTEKVLYGRTVDEIVPAVRPRLQRQRSLRMFHGGSSGGSSTGSGSGRRLSWSEYRSGGGSLKLSQAKAKKLMDECSTHFTDWEDAYDETELPIKAHKEKGSLLSRLFRRRSPSKKRSVVSSFSAQFPPPEWLDASKVLHLHSVAVQTQSAETSTSSTPGSVVEPKCSARSECSTSLSFSSPTPTRRSLQRRVTLSQTPSIRSESCSPFRNPTTAIPTIKLMSDERNVGGRTRGSPATSISSGLGRSFSPASAHSSYLRPLGILRNQSPPSPTQSTDSLYSSSVGPSASATCRSPVPSLLSKTTTFSQDRPFQRNNPARASYGGGGVSNNNNNRYRVPTMSNDNQQSRINSAIYQPFDRSSARSTSFRQPKSSTPLLGSSTPRPYVPLGRIGLDEQKRLIAQQRATIRDHFFQTPLTAPPLISSMMSANNNIGKAKYSPLPRMEEGGSHSSPANSTVTSANSTSSKKYYETDLDLTIKVPKKSLGSDQASTISQHSEKKRSGGNETSNGSRVINISVTKSESLNYVSQQNEANGNVINKENSADDTCKHSLLLDKQNFNKRLSEENFRTFPSLTELNINFKSITGQKILQGLNSNSTDTLVEVNMRDSELNKTEVNYV